MFSYYKKPIVNNNIPYKDITIKDSFNVIKGDYHRRVTHQARQIKDKDEYTRFKAENFDYVTFSGTFTYRNREGLQQLSGLMCLDLDHLRTREALKRYIINDKFLKPELIFTSPGGDGLKVVIRDPHPEMEYDRSYKLVIDYFFRKYGIKPDSTSDVSRACFMCYDPEAWIRPDHQLQEIIERHPMLGVLVDRFDMELIKIEAI